MPQEVQTKQGAYKNILTEDDLVNPLSQGARGAVEFLADGRAIIRAFETADASTAVHELAHVFRRDLYRTLDEASPDRRAAIAADIKDAEAWAGVKGSQWSREQEERFARAFERYLREGKAPTAQLAGVFARFKKWLTDLYKRIKGSPIDVKLSDQVRGVFDRMLGGKARAAERSRETPATERLEMTPFERKAVERLREIANKGKRSPDGTQYVSPQLTVEVKGKQRLVNVSAFVEMAGLEPVKGKPNYYRVKAEIKASPEFEEMAQRAKALLKAERTESAKERLRKKTEGEVGRADLPAGLSIAEIEKPPKPKAPKNEAAFPGEIEERWQAAKGARPPSLFQRLGEALTLLKAKATREYEHLPRTADYAELRFKLHQLAKGKGIASDEAIRLLQGVTVNLKPAQYDLFTRKIILDDLYEEATKQESREDFENHRLPFGFDAETLAAEHDRISKLAEADGEVATALADRRALVEEVTGDYLKAAKEGTGFEPKLDREFYYRHQVLDHLQGTRSTVGAGAKVKAPTSRGFLRRRQGSELDINTEYLQAEHQVLSQMLHDTMAFRLLHYVDQHWNLPLRRQMKAQAKAANDEALQLGKDYKEPEDFLPEGVALWQPRDGNAVYHVWSMPERQINEAVEQALASVDVPVEKLRRVMAMGSRRRELAIPEAVALTLDNFGKARDHNVVATTLQKGVRTWKVWQLISPRRVVKYNLRNISGDLDATLAGNPGSLKRLGPALTDLYNFLARKGAPTREMEEWLKRGGMYDLFQVAENMGDINGLKLFRNLAIGKSGKLEKINLWKQYWRAARLSTDFREAVLRYANFLDYADQVKQGKDGKPKNYGASLRDEVDALSDPYDKAYKLSNDLLGAYDEVSVIGQNIRETLAPFWSWQEVNAKRYKRLFMNAVYDGKTSRYVGRKLVSFAARSPINAMRIGRFLLKASLFAALLAAYNRLRFPKEEEELPPDVRSKPHLILGRDPDGKVRYFSRLGAAADFLDWFGADEAPRHVRDFLNGRKTIREIGIDMAKSPFNKVVSSLGPTTTMYELLTGKTIYPDATRPRGIRDRWEHAANSLGVGDEYRMLAGKPTRGYGQSLESFFDYKVDPSEAAYNEILGLKSDYLRKIGKGTGDVASSPRSNAAYYLKLALRYGDLDAARRYLAEYKALDGTPQGLRQSLEQLDPLAGMKDSERQAFLHTLTADDRARLAKAREFYQSVLAESSDNALGPVDLLPRPIPRETRAPVDNELRRLGVKLTFPERSVTVAKQPVELPSDQYGEYQQRAVEREYRGLNEMIGSPRYQALKEPEQKKTLERYTQALAEIERDQVKATLTLDSPDATRHEKFEARRDRAMQPLKERELAPNLFLTKQRIQALRER